MGKSIVQEFKKKGYFIGQLNPGEIKKVNSIKNDILKILKKDTSYTKKKFFFQNFHKIINKKKLNLLRLKIFNKLNKNKFNLKYYEILSKFIEPIIGNENVIQKKINLSIQMPNDDSSLLPVHSDTWAGDSPFEIVVWLPLVDCKESQSMFILPKDTKIFKRFNKIPFKNNNEIFNKIKKDIKFVNIKYGQVLIFSQNLPHGNIVNKNNKTRWSFNARTKSLMSPYSKKGLLDFFDIVKIFPATQDGLDYEYPNFK
jgi:sporadic carbohydrate cluster 2OG-Fe(II) oxygenase